MDQININDIPDGATLTDESCYRALAAKDARFDGVFFTGVKTTGIYCRPVCSVKTPRASSCVFFSTAAAAEAAGFRPCLRCRPELAPYALQQNLAYAVWQRIAAGALNDGDTERLAAEVGLSSRQLRRVLLQHFGVTPVELAQTQRLLFAKKLLQETRLAMSDVAYAAGFGSIRRFNALFLTRYGMAPTSIRRAAEKSSDKGADAITLRLAYRPPFAWAEMLHYLSGRAIAGVETVIKDAQGDMSYARSVRLGEISGWLHVQHLPEKNQLELSLSTTLAPALMPLLARIRSQFDLDANPQVIAAHLADDALLQKQISKTPGLRVPGTFDVFELAIRAVLGQQVSVAGATTLSGRLVGKFGIQADTPFIGVTHHFPTPERLAAASAAEVAAIGLPIARAEAIRNLAQFAAQGGLKIKPGTSLLEVVAHLKTVRGIGEWTAQYIAMRALRFTDAFPAGDLGLQKAAIELEDGVRLTEKQLLLRAANWSPWRGYAALLLWHSLS
ncbi:DNA-3-methyladenine glycosylase 2 family protein [Herminiimonas fonticola]|uniref:DNA-3-methyladenine glycosylase II n=1 Tax=Herminiimonas fonticola TaxID=303380 RepID=A0A4R6GFB7_9BURK|nr:DNA-3-methyladenine glycosylase 2 [Herminiimonas fonticola]RBA24464.1 AlkA N-terminal domain [Herminiimonas fonticola]TDN93581.1 DNA-3-methyladenine glycosylase II [Herminiimonas fonticola]